MDVFQCDKDTCVAVFRGSVAKVVAAREVPKTTVLRRNPAMWIRVITDGPMVKRGAFFITVFARRARACHDSFGR